MAFTSGCGLRPSETTKYRFVEPGKPLQITGPTNGKDDKIEVLANTLDNGETGTVKDVTGWVAMPPAQWRIVQTDLQRYADLVKAHPELAPKEMPQK